MASKQQDHDELSIRKNCLESLSFPKIGYSIFMVEFLITENIQGQTGQPSGGMLYKGNVVC